jgi:hypothetical protein
MNKLSEIINVSDAADWVPIALYTQFTGFGVIVDADDGEGVTVQLRKATSSAGANAADHGDAVTVSSTDTNVTVTAMTSAFAGDLGETAGGVAYTHVSCTITAAGSPAPGETTYGGVIRSDGRFSE